MNYTTDQVIAILESTGLEKSEAEFVLENTHFCNVDRCYNVALWEGWFDNKDFSGNKTGLMRRVVVCDDHKFMLKGYKEDEV